MLVTREHTERPEGVDAGVVKIVGTNKEDILAACKELLEDVEVYKKMSMAKNPYGDGKAAERILNIIKSNL